jgi:asparagine synthase (glutamine-hydrolysing)
MHVEEIFDDEKMAEMVSTIVQAFKTFDPIEIRNSCVVLAGLERAKRDGYFKVMTGDGGDELFAGYNYLSRYYGDLNRLDQELRRLWDVMHFSSKTLGERMSMEVVTPFLDPGFAKFAKSIEPREKVGEHGGQMYGKYILRRCFEPQLGALAWRSKMAQEQGAATDRFCNFLEKMIDDGVYINKSRLAMSEGVRIRSKEHLNYYAIFRSYFPPPQEESGNCGSMCPECHACFSNGRFCRTCGAFPVVPISL